VNGLPQVELGMAFSPCPNDTFIFHAMVNGRINNATFKFTAFIADVEELNKRAFLETYPLSKLSFYAYLLLKERYELLDAGAALGNGCGPILVAKKPLKSINDATIAVPGPHTTAFLLFRLWQGQCKNIIFTPFNDILPGIASGKYDAGLIIHEGRFVYPSYDCIEIIDLGNWWESETGLPIPLGCIALHRNMIQYKEVIEEMIRESIGYAKKNPVDTYRFIKKHAQEMDDSVIASHISLYVNKFSLSLGKEGAKAVKTLEDKAKRLGLI